MGSRFSESLFLDVPGTATEQVRTCAFRRNSSSLDRATKIRDSARLNSFFLFFSYPPFDLFTNLGDVLLSIFWIKRVLQLTFPFWNRGSENREAFGHCSLGDPCPEAVFSSHRSGNVNGSELEESHHRGSHFRMKIILGPILIWFLIFHVYVPECSRNDSRVCPCLWVQKKFVQFTQSTQNARLCPAELLGQFLSDSVFNTFRNLCDIVLNFRNGRVWWLAVPWIIFLCFSCNGCHLSFLSHCCHLSEGKKIAQQ